MKDRDALRSHFNNFIEKHPKGCIKQKDFAEFVEKIYPNKNKGKISKITKRLFNIYDEDRNGHISFREFKMAMFIMSDGNPEQNLRQIFRV